MGCDNGCGKERWNDVVDCESKAEDGVEDVVVGEVAGEGWADITDFVERLDAAFVELKSCLKCVARGMHTSLVVEPVRGTNSEKAGGHLGGHFRVGEGVEEWLVGINLSEVVIDNCSIVTAYNASERFGGLEGEVNSSLLAALNQAWWWLGFVGP